MSKYPWSKYPHLKNGDVIMFYHDLSVVLVQSGPTNFLYILGKLNGTQDATLL